MRRARASGKEKKAAAHACITLCREIEREWLRARANSASSHGFVQNESRAVFCSNERNAFSLTDKKTVLGQFKLFCPEPALAD